MITAERYTQITGDATSADLTATIAEAVQLLEETLDRPLAAIERTERIRPDRDGQLWPKATPVQTADGYTVDGYALLSAPPWPTWPAEGTDAVEVTYIGGWADPNAEGYDPAAANQLPACIARDLAWAVYRLLHPTAPSSLGVDPHATSARVGDVALTWKDSAGAATPGDTSSWWSKRTLAYRYRPVHTTPVGACR